MCLLRCHVTISCVLCGVMWRYMCVSCDDVFCTVVTISCETCGIMCVFCSVMWRCNVRLLRYHVTIWRASFAVSCDDMTCIFCSVMWRYHFCGVMWRYHVRLLQCHVTMSCETCSVMCRYHVRLLQCHMTISCASFAVSRDDIMCVFCSVMWRYHVRLLWCHVTILSVRYFVWNMASHPLLVTKYCVDYSSLHLTSISFFASSHAAPKPTASTCGRVPLRMPLRTERRTSHI